MIPTGLDGNTSIDLNDDDDYHDDIYGDNDDPPGDGGGRLQDVTEVKPCLTISSVGI